MRNTDNTNQTGLTLTNQEHVAPDVTVELDDKPPSEFWEQVATASGFQIALATSMHEVARETNASSNYECTEALLERGVTGLGKMYATVATGFLEPTTQGNRFQQALNITEQYCQSGKNDLSVDAGVGDLEDGPIALLDAGESTLTIQVNVTPLFFDLRADEKGRGGICQILSQLAAVADVRLVANTLTAGKLADKHHHELPGDVKSQWRTYPSQGPASESTEQALVELDDRPVRFVELVGGEDTETLRYSVVQGTLGVSRPTMSSYRDVLEDEYNLIRTFQRGQYKHVELTQAGREFLDLLEEEKRKQASLSDYSKSDVKSNPNSSYHLRVSRGKHGEGGEGNTEAATATTARSRTDRYGNTVQTQWLDGRKQAAIRATARDNGISLVDHPAEGYEDCRNRYIGYDDTDDELVVSLEVTSSVSLMAGLALTLTSSQMWHSVLTPDRLDGAAGSLAGLLVDDHTILRDGLCIGWLPNHVQDGASLIEELREAHEEVLEMTRTLKAKQVEHGRFSDEEAAYRGTILSYCHGVVGTMAALLDMAGVTPRYELRFADSNNVCTHDEKRKAVSETLAKTVSIQSRYGFFALNRHLFDTKAGKPSISPDVDAADPVGEFMGSFVLVGKHATEFEETLRQNLRQPADHRDDAPEVAVSVPIETPSRAFTGRVVSRVLSWKNITPTREAVSLLHGLTGSSYDAAHACYALGKESNPVGRDTDVVDVRYALSQLSWERLLPEMNRGLQKLVCALLRSEEPFTTQQELAEAVGVSKNTVTKHLPRLEAFGLLRETAAGLCLCLSMPDEDGGPSVPEYIRGEFATMTDVLYEAATSLFPAEAWIHTLDWYHAELDPLFEHAPWLEPWVDVLRTLCNDLEREPIPVTFGQTPEQAPLTATDASEGVTAL